jgi:hypothetical protein
VARIAQPVHDPPFQGRFRADDGQVDRFFLDIAAAWGVFVWKEFKNASKTTNWLLTGMFGFFIIGLVLIILARGV